MENNEKLIYNPNVRTNKTKERSSSTQEAIKLKRLMLAIVAIGHIMTYWIRDLKTGCWQQLDEKLLKKLIPNYDKLNDRARAKERRKLLGTCELVSTIKLPERLPNYLPQGPSPSKEQLRSGALGVLSLLLLFRSPSVGCRILALVLCGLRCQSLQKGDQSLNFTIQISNATPELVDIFKRLMKVIVPDQHYHGKRWRVRRKRILNYQPRENRLPRHIQDFGEYTVKPKGRGEIHVPATYNDAIASIYSAGHQQLREVQPFFQSAATVLINCERNDWGGMRLFSGEFSHYDPHVLEEFEAKKTPIAQILYGWWEGGSRGAWGRKIVQAAKASLGKPDNRYVQVTFDPKLLRSAVEYQVLLDFCSALEEEKILTNEELEPYRTTIKNVYAPEPEPEAQKLRMEDTEVFLSIMGSIADEHSAAIVPLSQRIERRDKELGAWRKISGTEYLVMPERTWARAYLKAARAADVDVSFSKDQRWVGQLQRILVENGLIKAPSSGYRYRYNLYEDNTRDKTYVVAVPKALLSEGKGRQKSGQENTTSGKPICPDARLTSGEIDAAS